MITQTIKHVGKFCPKRSFYRFIASLAWVCGLMACGAQAPIQDQQDDVVAKTEVTPVDPPQGVATAIEENVATQDGREGGANPTPSSVKSGKLDVRLVMAHQLLEQAQRALEQDRLTTPQNDNAYDKYRAVLLIDPTNLEAKAGEEAVKQRYAVLARDAIQRENLHSASQYIKTAQDTFPYDKLWTALQSELSAKRRELENRAPPQPVDVDSAQRLSLPTYQLAKKSESVKNLLQKVVARLQRTDESVMIYARSDAEGRWIYQTMKTYAPEYLIRGDIRIHERPALEFLAPLDW